MLSLEINSIFGLDNILTFKKGGGIHIKKKNRGKFTKSAKAAGESVQEHAAHVLSDPNATPLLKKRANFARNAAKWKHKNGGQILKLQNAGKFKTTSGSGYIPPSIDVTPSKKLPTAATVGQWLKGTLSYITGIKDSDLIESKYRPSKETDTTTKYYTRKGLDYDVMRNLLGGKESSAKTFEGEPLYYKNFNDLYNRLSNKTYKKGRLLRTTDNSHLGEYTIGIGKDNNGRYVSYYDKFDWAPNEELEIFSPYEIYNRIYEKDFNRMLKELNNETYSGSNPSGNWFFKSGINNKGYFKFGGKTNNAAKLKYQQGGILKGLFGLTARQRADESSYSAANESTFVKKPEINVGRKIIKNELSDDNSWEINNEDRVINTYPNVRNDKYVLEFFEYDYAPRFQRQNKFAPLYYVNLAKNIYSNTPINVYNSDDSNGGYEHNNKAGSFLGFDLLANPQVYLNSNYKLNRPTLVHELTHGFRQGTLGVTGDNRFSSYKIPINLVPNVSIGKVYNGSGYTNTEKNKLNKAYNMDRYKIDYDPLYEKGTTNTEVRFRLWKELYDKLGRRPTLEETDKFIKGYDNNRLGKTIRNANGYGWQMYKNGININDAKDALINVAMNDTPESNDYVDYAKRGIKIRKVKV